MKNIRHGLFIFSLAAVATVAFAKEERNDIKFEAMPESVRATVSNFIKADNITKIEQVSDDGHIKFEITSNKTVGNKEFTDMAMTVATDGEIMKISKEVPVFKIPFPIMQEINRQYPGLKVNEVEIVQTRHFLLQGNKEGQPVNLKIFDDGTIRDVSSDKTTPGQASRPEQKKSSATPTEEEQLPLPKHIDELPDDDFENEIKPLLNDK